MLSTDGDVLEHGGEEEFILKQGWWSIKVAALVVFLFLIIKNS